MAINFNKDSVINLHPIAPANISPAAHKLLLPHETIISLLCHIRPFNIIPFRLLVSWKSWLMQNLNFALPTE